MMHHSYFYDKYFQSYDFYYNSMQQDCHWPVAGLRSWNLTNKVILGVAE